MSEKPSFHWNTVETAVASVPPLDQLRFSEAELITYDLIKDIANG